MAGLCVFHITWNPYLERWILKDMLGANVFELPDCGNFRMLFKDADKTKDNCFVMKTELKPGGCDARG
jgi:hypothetical protein